MTKIHLTFHIVIVKITSTELSEITLYGYNKIELMHEEFNNCVNSMF